MTLFQAICILIIGLCVIWWMYETHRQIRKIYVLQAHIIYLAYRLKGMKDEDAADMMLAAVGDKDDRTKILKKHSRESNGNTP